MSGSSEKGCPDGPSNKKGKSSAGRKPGYKMQAWQKELQLASMRNRDLEQFNRFLIEFIDVHDGYRGERFFVERDHSGQPFYLPEDDVFILRDILHHARGRFGHTLFLYENMVMSGQRLCLKVFDQYSFIKEGKLYPLDDEVRTAFRKTLLAMAERHGIKAFEEDFLPEPAWS
ncbi:MAG: hypothetical protein ACLFN0_07250 [Thermovirgaceae bacterium]